MDLFLHAKMRTEDDPLDQVLLGFSSADPFTIRDAFEGVQIFGGIGSGKTSGSGALFARSYLAAGFDGLVLTAKVDETDLWRRYAQETGREGTSLSSSDRMRRITPIAFSVKYAGVIASLRYYNQRLTACYASLSRRRVEVHWCFLMGRVSPRLNGAIRFPDGYGLCYLLVGLLTLRFLRR